MRVVKQRHDKGCGQACAAMLAGVTFKTANEKFKGLKDNWFSGSKTRELRELLIALKVKVKGTRLRPLGNKTLYDLPETCVLKLASWLGDMGYSTSWHWVVLHKKRVYDPCFSRSFPISRFFAFYEKTDVVTSFLEIDYKGK